MTKTEIIDLYFKITRDFTAQFVKKGFKKPKPDDFYLGDLAALVCHGIYSDTDQFILYVSESNYNNIVKLDDDQLSCFPEYIRTSVRLPRKLHIPQIVIIKKFNGMLITTSLQGVCVLTLPIIKLRYKNNSKGNHERVIRDISNFQITERERDVLIT